jgi:hypothetical protein
MHDKLLLKKIILEPMLEWHLLHYKRQKTQAQVVLKVGTNHPAGKSY